jgi:hypothetical protein
VKNYTYYFSAILHRKNEFAEVSRNLDGYRSENNFERCANMIINAARSIDTPDHLEHPIIILSLFYDLTKIIFRCVFS